ncbi:hypothetical protein ACG2F4_17615, partial [Halalkalibaculum sp. DA3122]|uniref:hypothetical protein n=1 Tax=Halalkalibaculum sp. DA3122 TaxID=3373607 RepID=UPI003754BE94
RRQRRRGLYKITSRNIPFAVVLIFLITHNIRLMVKVYTPRSVTVPSAGAIYLFERGLCKTVLLSNFCIFEPGQNSWSFKALLERHCHSGCKFKFGYQHTDIFMLSIYFQFVLVVLGKSQLQ